MVKFVLVEYHYWWDLKTEMMYVSYPENIIQEIWFLNVYVIFVSVVF
jgi:hypothetical protein